jgi:hypothetical protein
VTDDRRGARLLVIAIALALGALWVIPGVAVAENRAPREFPDPSRAGFASAADFRALDAALLDRLPAKGSVVSVLGTGLVGAGLSPTTGVFRGVSGEPFLGQDFVAPCLTRERIAAVDAITRDVRDELARYGIDLVYAVAPDKSSIERDALGPAADPMMRCSDEARATLEAYAAAPGSPLLVGWDELAADPGRVYLYGDSHWNPHGAALFAELIIDRLGDEGLAAPGIFDREDLVAIDTVAPPGDLFRIMGVVRPEPTTLLRSDRDGVVTTGEVDFHDGVYTQRWVSTGPDLIGGRTLLLHDSFVAYDQDVLAPYFADLTALPLASLHTPGALAGLFGYDLVIVQQVQRSVPNHIADIAGATWITTGQTTVTHVLAPPPVP